MDDNRRFKRMKLPILFTLCILLSLSFIVNVSAVECGSVPSNMCTVSISTTFAGGVYYLNGSGSTTDSGSINIGGSNLILDGNGSTIIGNFSSAGIYQFSTGRNNVTIKNITLVDVGRGLFLRNGYNNTIKDINISNFIETGIGMRNETNVSISNINIYSDNTISNVGFQIDTASNLINVSNVNITGTYQGILLIPITANVENNTFTSVVINSPYYGVYTSAGSNYNIFSNISIYNSTLGVRFNSGLNNSLLHSYIYQYNNTGVLLAGSNYSKLFNNIIIGKYQNSTNDFGIVTDTALESNISYNFINRSYYGIFVGANSPNTTVSFNNVSNTYWGGLQAMGISTRINSSGTLIFNNNVINSGWNGFDIASNDISMYNNFIANSSHNGVDFLDGQVLNYHNNLLFYNNTVLDSFGSSINLFYYGFNNSIHDNYFDNSNVLTRSYCFVVEMNNTYSGNNSFYNNHISNFVNGIFSSSNAFFYNNSFYNVSNYLYEVSDYYLDSYPDVAIFNNYYDKSNTSIFIYSSSINSSFYNLPSLLYLKNNDTIKLSYPVIYNRTNALLVSSSGSLCNGSSSDLTKNTDQINITLSPSQDCYVFDKFDPVNSLPTLRTIFTESELNRIYLQIGIAPPNINSICSSGGITFQEAMTLVGMILTLTFIASVLGILVLTFTNILDLEKVKKHFDLQNVLIAVMIIGLTGLLLSTVAYALINGFCGSLI